MADVWDTVGLCAEDEEVPRRARRPAVARQGPAVAGAGLARGVSPGTSFAIRSSSPELTWRVFAGLPHRAEGLR